MEKNESYFFNSNLNEILPENKKHLRNSIFTIHRSFTIKKKNNKYKKASTKTRSEVRGGGRKPWKQKGTGNARSGSNSSPLWKGGGVIFGPKPRQVKKKINRKEKQLALKYVLYSKIKSTYNLSNSNFEVFFSSLKTTNFLKNLKNFGIDPNSKIGIIFSENNKNLYLATRNLKNVILMSVFSLNIENLLKIKYLIITDETIRQIKSFYSKI
jgi:large subunit ribosomal protein L4